MHDHSPSPHPTQTSRSTHLTNPTHSIRPTPTKRHHSARTATALLTTLTATIATLATLTPTASATPSTAPTTSTTSTTSTIPHCTEAALTIKASIPAPQHPDVLRISATNRTTKPCVIDRIPTVTFGDLDGAAEPDPPTESAPYRLAPGSTAYATVRTVTGRPTPSARTVDFITVAADPSHHGRRFDATAIGAPPAGICVWTPTTTWWRPTPT
ncbi:DUF4232 domain-containing protein [Streptomyces monomycini]|uniref:DUF4232 domain-containing protein n=1 Tax=Streptomyces monomycini TaxID=371720 RepID=UPI0009973CF5|nr:DUF4232 domain-containing protein [Streptomyces monomycini]